MNIAIRLWRSLLLLICALFFISCDPLIQPYELFSEGYYEIRIRDGGMRVPLHAPFTLQKNITSSKTTNSKIVLTEIPDDKVLDTWNQYDPVFFQDVDQIGISKNIIILGSKKKYSILYRKDQMPNMEQCFDWKPLELKMKSEYPESMKIWDGSNSAIASEVDNKSLKSICECFENQGTKSPELLSVDSIYGKWDFGELKLSDNTEKIEDIVLKSIE